MVVVAPMHMVPFFIDDKQFQRVEPTDNYRTDQLQVTHSLCFLRLYVIGNLWGEFTPDFRYLCYWIQR